MKKKMKRPLAVLLALIMMFSTVSGTGLNLSAEELQTSEVEILTTEDSTADTEEDKSGDTKDINQEEEPEAENESEGDELTESEESEDEVEPAGDIESEADVQPASEEEDKSEPVTETEDDADDEESEKTETPAEITRYDYKSDEVNVLVTLTDPADLPDAAELVVEPITLQREAQKNIEEAAAEEGIFVEEIKAFDIKFMLDGEEVQPGATVKVSVSVPEFKPSEEASAVYHVDENNEVENMESEVAADGEVVFDAPHFSTYVIVDGSIINDATKKITVTLKHYTKDALVVSEDSNGVITSVTVPTDTTHQLYLDDQIQVPVGGEIYNYIKADNWKPDTVYVDYTNPNVTDKVYTNSADLKEISLTDDAAVWVYYTPDSSRMIGASSFYDYTVKAGEDSGIYYSINMKVAQEAEASDSTAMIVGYAGSSIPENYPSIYNSGKISDYGSPNRGGTIANLTVFLDENGDVEFNYPEPGFFENSNWTVEVGGETHNLREVHKDIQLGFERKGDTYNFDQVIVNEKLYNKGKTESKGVISETGWNGEKSKGYSFYPLQEFVVPYEESGSNVNGFFGMRYDVEFFLGDYVGDLNFTYNTRDELWVLLDGQTIAVNKTGYDKKEESVDLSSMIATTNLNAKHTLTVLYLDRYQPDKSILEMSFTLPNVKIKEVDELNDSGEIVDTLETSLKLKTVDQNNNSLEGARFQLKNMSTAATTALVTTANGVEFTGLTAGEYQLMLANAPNSCLADANSWRVIVKETDANSLEVTMYEEKSGKTVSPTDGIYIIGVKKVEGTKLVLRAVSNDDNPMLLGGAKFKLENQDGDFSETLNTDFVTGELIFNGLSAGQYTLTHLKAPKGCELIGTNTEWTVEVTETNGTYSVSMSPDVGKIDGAYIYKYVVEENEYTKPEEALTYDKKAKVLNWDERTYEIDISAEALEVESIQQIDTTYGVFVFDRSTSMFNGLATTTPSIGSSGATFGDLTDLDSKTVYRMDNEYVLYRDDYDSWYRYNSAGYTDGDYNGKNWKPIGTSDTITAPLEYHGYRFDYLREVAVGYIEDLAQHASQSKIGISIFNTTQNSESIMDMTTVTSNATVVESILGEILNIKNATEKGSNMHLGLEKAYQTFFKKASLENGAVTFGEPTDIYIEALKENIPMYVIVVSDGNVDSRMKAELWANALKDKGITVYTVATNTANEGGYKAWLKESIASFGCAYEATDPSKLSEIFSQIQIMNSASTISGVTVKDYIDPRFVVLDESGNEITEKYHCDATCAEDCAGHWKEEENVTYDNEETCKVGYDSAGRQYVVWEDQSIIGTEQHWRIKVKAREDYIGGNNVKTNIDTEPIISTPENSYSIVSPTVNVKADLKVANHEYMLYKGEKVPTNDDVLNKLFDRSSNSKYSKEAFVKYGIMESTDGTDPISLKWYSDKECTQQVNLASEKADSGKSYYLKVTYDTSEPSNESNANTTDSAGVVHFVGTAVEGNVYRQTAVNAEDVNLSYGTYTINVWELIKQDAETKAPLSGAEFELSSDDNTYTGKSNAQGSVEWIDSKDTTQYSLTLPITELDIAAGEYTLTETCAPEKYKLITTEWTAKKTAAKGWETLPTGDETKTENGITKVYINNEKAPSEITITKKVTGNLGSKTKLFTFTVTLTDADNNAIEFPAATQNDSYKVDLTETNKATFDLKDGDSITIDDLPVGAKLTILESTEDLSESDGNNYTVTVKKDNADVTNSYNTETGITVNITDTSSTVAFTNNRSATLDTGILSDTPKVQNTLLAVTFAASVIGILAYLDRKRSKYDYRR